MEDEIQERLVERGQTQKRYRQQHRAGDDQRADQPVRTTHVRGGQAAPGSSSENDTSGAQDGAVIAIVSASATPMTMPATSGPSALPSPPIITAAKTTPIQA